VNDFHNYSCTLLQSFQFHWLLIQMKFTLSLFSIQFFRHSNSHTFTEPAVSRLGNDLRAPLLIIRDLKLSTFKRDHVIKMCAPFLHWQTLQQNLLL
jgi:hypothetical protein